MSLLCLDFKSIAVGLDATNMACALGDIEILETSAKPCGNFHLLAQGENDLILDIQKKLSAEYDQVVDSCTVQSEIKELLNALFGLKKIEISDSLLILETETLSTGIFICSKFTKQDGTTLIELDSGRANGGICVAYITGPEQVLKSLEQEILKDRPPFLRNLTNITRPNEKFLKYFTL